MPDTPAPPPRARATQDRKIADLITSARRRLARARTDAEIGAALAAFGYDDARLAQGDALADALQAAFDARQHALAAQKAASAAFAPARKAAEADFTAFRRIARRLLPDASAATDLGLAGDMPADLDQFVTQARSAYAAAARAPHAATLAPWGYPAERLGTLGSALTDLLALDTAHRNALAAATAATAQRDRAADALADYTGLLREVLRPTPALLARLDAP